MPVFNNTTQKTSFSIVATDHDYGKEYIDYVIEGFVHRIYFRIFNKEKLYKLLNTVCKKDYSQEELSNSDYMKIINCIIFAKKPYAQDIIEKCAYLFALIENIKLNHQLDLHLALKMGIKNHFQKNNKKMEELLTVITKAINKTKIDELGGYEVKQYTIEELETKLQQKEKENQTKLQQKEKENQKTQEKLLQKLLQKEKEIKKLQQILQKNNITI